MRRQLVSWYYLGSKHFSLPLPRTFVLSRPDGRLPRSRPGSSVFRVSQTPEGQHCASDLIQFTTHWIGVCHPTDTGLPAQLCALLLRRRAGVETVSLSVTGISRAAARPTHLAKPPEPLRAGSCPASVRFCGFWVLRDSTPNELGGLHKSWESVTVSFQPTSFTLPDGVPVGWPALLGRGAKKTFIRAERGQNDVLYPACVRLLLSQLVVSSIMLCCLAGRVTWHGMAWHHAWHMYLSIRA